MGGETTILSSSREQISERVVFRDLELLEARLLFFRSQVGSYSRVFNQLFKVVETPEWNEKHTELFKLLRELSDELH